MKTRIGLWSMGILATFGVACGGGSAAKPLTASDYCGQLADKECQVTDTCNSSEEDCRTLRKQNCLDDIEATVMAPRVFVEANVAPCVNQAATVYKKTAIKPSDLQALTDLCGYVHQGEVETNEPCNNKYDCKDKNQVCDKGLCAKKLPKGANELCADPGATCPVGQYCTMSGMVLKCLEKKGTDEACNATTPCLETLRCTGGKCAPLLESGDACLTDADCPTAAPYCDPYAGKECTKGLTFATHSPSCAPFGDDEAGAPPTTGAAGTGAAGTGAAGTGAAGTGAAGTGAAGAAGTGAAGTGAAGAAGSDGGAAAGSDGGSSDAASAE